MGKQPAEQSLQEQSRGCTNREKYEASFDDTLRQAALAVVPALLPSALQDQHQARLFQQMSRVMLITYVQQYENTPSPDEIQHMRDLIRTLWKDLVQEHHCKEMIETTGDFSSLVDGERADLPQE